MNDGCPEGCINGWMLGCALGCINGCCEGRFDGCEEGSAVVGNAVGNAVGKAVYMTMLQSYCTDEYIIGFILLGTYKIFILLLQGEIDEVPKAFEPILLKLVGRLIEVKPSQS